DTGCTAPLGREARESPTPRTSNPASATRSPSGPKENGPASGVGKRQSRVAGSSGETAQLRPRATNATTAPGTSVRAGHPSGRAATTAAAARPPVEDVGAAGR